MRKVPIVKSSLNKPQTVVNFVAPEAAEFGLDDSRVLDDPKKRDWFLEL